MRLDAARLLIEAGANIEIRGRTTGAIPLVYAASHGRTDVVGFLLDAGADPTARTNKDAPRLDGKYRRADMSARDLAIKHKNRDMVDLLDAALLVWNGQPRKGCLHAGDKRFSDLAERHLGDSDRWWDIHELNNMEKGQPIRAGDCFLLPDK